MEGGPIEPYGHWWGDEASSSLPEPVARDESGFFCEGQSVTTEARFRKGGLMQRGCTVNSNDRSACRRARNLSPFQDF